MVAHRALLALLLLLSVSNAQLVNPVKIPIIKNAMQVHTRVFAKLPDFLGQKARIICMASMPGSNDLFVCTLHAIYRVKPSGSVSLFLNVLDAVKRNTDRELNIVNKVHGGVRSIAFHPDFKSKPYMYISAMEDRPKNPKQFNYISDIKNGEKQIPADSVLLEFEYDKAKDEPKIDSYRNVFRVGMPVYDHPIKQIMFRGPLLYISHGDGSVQDAIAGGGQNNDALGKILRINPMKSGSKPYTVPSDNPFVGDSSMKDEVFAFGFRNPHNLCFGKDGTLYVADTGRSNVEEVNLVEKGKNYGWSFREGTFVHAGGGLISGIRDLPSDDAKNGFVYPAAQVGHVGKFRDGFIGQAIAGACPVENGSPMNGNYYYADFPKSGKLFFSSIKQLKKAKTTGPPSKLKQARTKQAVILFDHDNDPKTKPIEFDTLGDLMRSEPGLGGEDRVDVRFGRGSKGELYWSSKKSGQVYLFTSSVKGGPGGKKKKKKKKKKGKK